MDPLIITVAGVGAELTLEQQPNLPVTPEDLARDAADCAEAGASIYHLHVRDSAGRPTMDVGAFESGMDAIRGASDLIVQFTSGGAVNDTAEDRIAPLELRPEMASLTTGTVNFGDDVFSNPAPLVARFYERMRRLGIVPEFEIFEAGMIDAAERLCRAAGDEHHRHFDFVLGVPGAMPAWPDAVDFLRGHLPAGASWSATGIGRAHEAVALAAIASGGHVRTGFEDVRYLGPGEPARSNRQLVERVAAAAAAGGRQVATPAVAREILGLA
ncbi:MAG TPA: 3-keto-5-aminohexanoate cleavage protein [Actinomycetota bacterium]